VLQCIPLNFTLIRYCLFLVAAASLSNNFLLKSGTMKYFYFISIFIFYIAGNLQAQQIVKDVNTTIASNGYKSSTITKMTVAGANTYFVANDASSGDEPWVTDGTAAGTHILRDINPGKSSSVVDDFTYSNGYVFFKATDGTHGYELWRTDGTTAGTVMVKDINTGFTSSGAPNSGSPRELCDVNGVLYFVVNNDASMLDYAIWKTDGTEAGTVFVNNINIWSAGNPGAPVSLTNFNGLLHYTESVNSQPALYRITGAGVTELVLNINASKLTVIGSAMYFSGQTSANGAELWKTDGTTVGTVLVKDIYPGTQNSTPDLFTNVNGTLFFTAWDGINGAELWKSDGTEAGTVMVKDITTAENSTINKPTALTNVNGTLFFNGYTAAAGKELWKSDGTGAGTVLVKDIIPGSSFPTELINNNGTLLFIVNNHDLWKSDGTEAGTVLVQVFSLCQFLTTVTALPGHVVFYAPASSTNNNELWISNGNTAGTNLLKNIAVDNPASLYSYTGSGQVAEQFAHANGQLFFPAKNTNTANHSLYSSYGSPATTVKLDGAAGLSTTFPSGAVNAGGYIYFAYSDAVSGSELWKSDGTVAGTTLLKDIRPGTIGSSPINLFNLNGIVYFTANDGTNGKELWKTDGTTAGTVLVKDINTGSAPSNPSQFTNFNGLLYFAATTSTSGNELWKSDGTAAGTILVKDIYPGNNNSVRDASNSPGNYFTVIGNQLFFSAIASFSQNLELWKTDGTTAGTVLVKDINTRLDYGSDPSFITAVGNKIIFVANDYGFGSNKELWVSDGTTIGTDKIKEINAGNNPSSPCNLINLNGTLYFSAFEPTTGYELWKTDGTTAGTILVKDIEPGVLSGMQAGEEAGQSGVPFFDITKANGILYFPAATADNGRELWKSDGTAAGTVMVGDLFAGPQSSDPEQVTNANGDIYFVAENGNSGKEVFSFKPNDFFVLPPVTVEDSMDIDWQNILLVNGTNQIIASIKQSGIKPLNGLVKTKLTVGASAINYNGRNLARKHFDIEPTNDAAIATATVTLYFSQADFTQYNSDDNINGDLPINPTDAAGKAALRIIQYHGVGTAPGNYPGAEEIINPADDSIVWNAAANYWEVSFTVTGFSGFYLSSVVAGPLPVRLISFNGTLNNDKTVSLQWKVEEQLNIIRYEIEKSTTGNNFIAIGNVNANTLNTFTYQYKDVSVITDKVFYRIKIIDQNGRIAYSDIVNINIKKNNSIRLYPVPAVNYIIIQTKDAAQLNSIATIIDNKGRMMQQVKINSANQWVNIGGWAAGLYYVKLTDGTLLKFQK
jgi:ELWxxDGT repeat protein